MASLKILSSDQMFGVSRLWLDPTKARPLLEKYDTVKPQLKKLDAVHAQLLHNQASNTGQSDALDAIKREAEGVDGVHDRKITGVVGLLHALAQLTDDAAQHDRLLNIVERLVPDGLSIVNASYLAEAGAAERSEGRLTRDDLTLMGAIPLPAPLGNLEVQYDAYLAAGRRLGDLEAERAKVEGTPSGPSKSDAAKVRGAWIGLVNAILSCLENEDVSAADLQTIVGPLHRAQAAAARSSRTQDDITDPALPTSAPSPKP